MKNCIIKQPAGIGDIFFCQKIAKKLSEQGYNIIWPVINEFLWVKDYIKCFNFCSIADDFPLKEQWMHSYGKTHIRKNDDIVLNLQDADALWSNISVMEAKYKMVDLSFDDWSLYLNIHRNFEKEKLLQELLGVNNEPFVFVSRLFGSPPNSKACEHLKDFNSPVRIIEMNILDGFTLIDWMGIFELATEVHVAESSLNYLIEISKLDSNLHMYSKWTPPSYFHICNLFKKPWIYH